MPPLKKLRVINAAKNRMVDLKPLDLITSLHNLDISHNLLEDLQDVIDVLSRIPGLKVYYFMYLGKLNKQINN